MTAISPDTEHEDEAGENEEKLLRSRPGKPNKFNSKSGKIEADHVLAGYC